MAQAATGFIPDDGFTEHGYVKEHPGLYPRVEFHWRPMLIEELVAFDRASAKLEGMPLREFVAALMAAKIKAWDLRDPRGQPVPVGAASLLRLKAPLFERLWAVVNLSQPADGFLGQDDAEAREAAEDLMESARTGRPIAAVREERLRKNS